MGKVMLIVNLQSTEAVYYAGETVSGEAIIETDEEIKTREIRVEVSGSAQVQWHEGSGENRREYRNKEVYFQTRIVLCKDDPESFVLQPGHYKYPFQVALPPQLPSSFESFNARVRYCMQLIIDRPWHIDDTLTRAFTVLSHLDLNQVANVLTPLAVEDSKILCCCCCKTGPISGSLKIERNGFVPGERIPIHAVCVNKSNRAMEGTRVSLWQGITCRATLKSRRFTQKLELLERPPIQPGDTDVWKGDGLPVPPCAPTGLPGCDIIDIDYFVLLEVDPTGPSLDLEVSLPVVIGTIPPTQILNNYVFAGSSAPSFHPDYPSLPAPSYEAFTVPDMVVYEVPEDEGGNFIPSYPVYSWNTSK